VTPVLPSSWPATLQPLCLGREPKARVATLDVNMHEVNSMLFTHGKGAGDIGIWHKRVSHVNLQRFKQMEK
jgi:hypothetical protein